MSRIGHVLSQTTLPASEQKPEFGERLARERAAREALNRQQAWERICPPLYRETDQTRLPNQDKLEQVLRWEYGPSGLYLLGPTGSGKTRIAYLLLERLLDEGFTIEAYSCVEFSHAVNIKFSAGHGPAWIDRLARVDVLFFDDLGKSVFTERCEAEISGLIERRVANLRPLLVTSNATSSVLKSKMTADRADPLIRRLKEFCSILNFTV